jgi:hypothetical protein
MLPMTRKLLQLVKHVSTGMSQALVISPDRAYVRPANNAFQVDNAKLKSDTRKIGSDLKKQLNKYQNVTTYQR